MFKVKTKSGFECDIDENNLNNMELIDAIVESEENPLVISKVCLLLVGKENRKALYDHLRENGVVPINKVSDEIIEIFNTVDPGKK